MKTTAIGTVISLGIWLGLWFAVTHLGIADTEFLTSPDEIFRVLVDLAINGYAGSSLWLHFFVSLWRTLIGFGAAVLVAVPVGLLKRK